VPKYHFSDPDYYLYIMPTGLAYICSILKQNSYIVDVLNLNASIMPEKDQLVEKTSKVNYLAVLTGGLSTHFKPVKDVVSIVKSILPETPVVAGGGLITSLPRLMFDTLKADYIVMGEGEISIVDLLASIRNNATPSEVDGIGYRDESGEIILNKARQLIKNLDELPYPDYEAFGLRENLQSIKPSTVYYYDILDNPKPYPINASRSCPYQCTFCFHPIGDIYKQRSIDNIMSEIKYAINKFDVNIIDIYDELFSHDHNRVIEFCTKISDLSKSVSDKIMWSAQMRVDGLERELVNLMRGSGCYILSLGLESYSPVVLKSMRKKILPSQIENALKICSESNMTIQGNFIFGDRAETIDTAWETIEFWKKSHTMVGNSISLGYIHPYPGSALYQHSVSKGIIKDQLDFIENHINDPINMSDTMTDDEWKQLQKEVPQALSEFIVYVAPRSANNSNGIVETGITCPFCRVTSIYKNYKPVNGKDVCCRNYRKRFYIYSSMFVIIRKLQRIPGIGRILNLLGKLTIIKSIYRRVIRI